MDKSSISAPQQAVSSTPAPRPPQQTVSSTPKKVTLSSLPVSPTPEIWFKIGRDIFLKMKEKMNHSSDKTIIKSLFTNMSENNCDCIIENTYEMIVGALISIIITKIFPCNADSNSSESDCESDDFDCLTWDEWVGCTTDNDIRDRHISIVKDVIKKNGYVWDNYFSFLRRDIYKALTGELPLTPKTFKSVHPKVEQIRFYVDDEDRDKELPSRRLQRLWRLDTNGQKSWNKETLRDAIREYATVRLEKDTSTKRSEWKDIDVKLSTILNFKLITGDDIDMNMSLPGLDLPLFPDNHVIWSKVKDRSFGDANWYCMDLIFWKKHDLGRAYLLAVYDALIDDYPP